MSKRIRSKKRESQGSAAQSLSWIPKLEHFFLLLRTVLQGAESPQKAGENKLAKRRRTTCKTVTDVSECCVLKLETRRCPGVRVGDHVPHQSRRAANQGFNAGTGSLACQLRPLIISICLLASWEARCGQRCCCASSLEGLLCVR